MLPSLADITPHRHRRCRVARADNLAVRTLADLRGRVVEGLSGDGLLPFWRLFADAGLSLLQDPAQVSMSVRVRASVRLRVFRRT